MDYQVDYNSNGKPQRVRFEPSLANSHGEYNRYLANHIIKEFGVPGWDWKMPTLSQYCETTQYLQSEIDQAQARVSALIEEMEHWTILNHIYEESRKEIKHG